MDAKGFFQALLDFSFEHFVTVRLVGVIYALALAAGVVYALIAVVGAFETSPGFGVLTLLILAPLGLFLYAVAVRVALEATVALLRVAENTREIRDLLKEKP
ncbi:hypothetical protein GCM10007092_02040 [Thermus composti]|uniref:DUF4282 domain-containing protein n=1 Tax=Thermus composti TaxID=532059 RepID=A0ABV6PY77_9DEIN|nr:DUF4282 domain-containing protein [Thermus composti]GGM92536.1 hypothetical protein GCM10007092_02040 [Thermus composti]